MEGFGSGAFGAGPFGGSGRNPLGETPEDVTAEAPTAEVRVTAEQLTTARIVTADQVVTVEERQMLEVVLTAVRGYLEDGAPSIDTEEAAQVQAAADTLHTQLQAPRPSRNVLAWAVDQLKTVPAGYVTGVAASYFPDLLRLLHVT